MNRVKEIIPSDLFSKAKIILYSILILAVFLRFYNFSESLRLTADNAMAYLIAERIINEKFILLVGPTTSFGEFVNVVPPTYYYLITFLYWISRSDAVVTFFFAIIEIWSVYIIYLLGREIDSVRTGLFASFLYTVSYTMINYSHNILEPYRLPFFIIISLYFLFRSQRKKSFVLLFFASLFFVISLMYVSSFLLFPSFIFFYILFFNKLKPKIGIILAIFQFFFLLSLFYLPVFIYEFQNNYPSIRSLLQQETNYFSFHPVLILNSLLIHLRLFIRSIFPIGVNYYLTLIIFSLLLIYGKYLKKMISKNKNILIIFTMFLSSILFTGLYAQEAYSPRIAVLYPLFFLLLAYFLSWIYRQTIDNSAIIKTSLYFMILFIMIQYLKSNFVGYQFLIQYNKRKFRYHSYFQVAEYIIKSSENSNYSIFAIINDRKTGYDNTSYYYALQKLSGRDIASYNDAGNWIKVTPNVTKGWLYLICKNYNVISSVSDDQCFEEYKKISKVKRNYYLEKKYIGNDIVYKINAADYR